MAGSGTTCLSRGLAAGVPRPWAVPCSCSMTSSSGLFSDLPTSKKPQGQQSETSCQAIAPLWRGCPGHHLPQPAQGNSKAEGIGGAEPFCPGCSGWLRQGSQTLTPPLPCQALLPDTKAGALICWQFTSEDVRPSWAGERSTLGAPPALLRQRA